MAYNVTPTSGEGPYLFSASFTEIEAIESGRFALEFRGDIMSGTCVVDFTLLPDNPTAAASLLDTGTFTRNANVNVGSCYATQILLRDTLTNTIIDSATVNVSNIA